MTDYKIQSMADLEAEMRAAARGEKAPPEGAAQPSVKSADVLIRLLTPENRDLLKTIRDEHPRSVADLAAPDETGRAQPAAHLGQVGGGRPGRNAACGKAARPVPASWQAALRD